MPKGKKLAKIGLTFLGVVLLGAAGSARASTLVTQTALPGDCVPQFKVEMPVFGPAGDLPRVDALKHPMLTVKMKEVGQTVLPDPLRVKYPSKDSLGNPCPHIVFQDTKVWAYETSDSVTRKVLGPANWPGVTLEATRFNPTLVKYENELPAFDVRGRGMNFVDGLVQGLLTVDQTLMWADPLNLACGPIDCTKPENARNACCKPFVGRPPTVPHLHGAEVPAAFDGGPLAWFTADGRKGPDYSSVGHPGAGEAIYQYNNTQEPGTLWFHDHALGATRTNVYSGLEAFYFLRDASKEPKNLPSGPYEIEMALQDRQFDTHSQLFFPDGSGADVNTSNLNGPPTNPDVHPFWNPEFIGDVAVVNGAPWPFLEVEPRRYLFRLLDGSNARVFRLNFGSAPVYQVGADDNYLEVPVRVDRVFLAPAERAYVIVDFSNLRGETIAVTNDAPVPFPDGLVPGVDQPGMARIMQFRVSSKSVSDSSCNPKTECRRPIALPRLTDGRGRIAAGVKIDKVRRLALKEHSGPGGPLEVLLNNTNFDAMNAPNILRDFPDAISELPRIGTTELWEIVNMTADAHPIHTHLVQYQILNRESFDVDGTQGSGIVNGYIGIDNGDSTSVPGAWAEAFGFPLPAQCDNADPLNPCPGFGPPLKYDKGDTINLPNGQKNVPLVGGNPDVGPYLLGDATPPAPEESGYKDTAKSVPGQVMRILLRWAPTSTHVGDSRPGVNLYPFDPTQGAYMWHCHILDHEDNDMMREYKVKK
jgi:spore coat protein A